MNCSRRDFFNCKLQYENSSNTCGCLFVDYMPLVDKCDVKITAILQVNNDRHKELERNKVVAFIETMVKKIFLLRIDTQVKWKKNIIVSTLSLMMYIRKYQFLLYFLLSMLMLLLIVCFNVLLVGVFAFLSLIVYLSIMQVDKDLKNYIILELNHQREIVKNEMDITQVEFPTVINNNYVKCQIIHSLLEEKYGNMNENEFDLYERKYIQQLVDSLSLSKETLKSKTILVGKYNSEVLWVYNYSK